MTTRTCLIIQGNYPENIKIDSQSDGNKFMACAYLMKDGNIHSLLVSTNNEFETKEASEKYLHDTFKQILNMDIGFTG